MKTKKFLTLLLGLVLVFSMTAYTAMANDNAMSKGNETMSTMDNKCECGMADKCECDATAACGGDCSDMYEEPQSVEEALALHKKLMAQENAILSQNTELWEKVYMEADKGMALVEDGKNYGEYLMDTIEAAKDQFTDEDCSNYAWDYMEADFATGDYDGAVIRLMDALCQWYDTIFVG